MTPEGFIIWAGFFGIIIFLAGCAAMLCEAAAKPTPSPLDRVKDYDPEDDLEMNWCVLEGGKK